MTETKKESKADKFLKDLKETVDNALKRNNQYVKQMIEEFKKNNATATKAFRLKPKTDYQKNNMIFVHCISTNSQQCILQIGGQQIKYPPESFIKGAIYKIKIEKIISHGNVEFMAYD